MTTLNPEGLRTTTAGDVTTIEGIAMFSTAVQTESGFPMSPAATGMLAHLARLAAENSGQLLSAPELVLE